jgi:hypothetical protein
MIFGFLSLKNFKDRSFAQCLYNPVMRKTELTNGRSSSESVLGFLRFGGDGSFLIVTGVGTDLDSFLIEEVFGESLIGVDSTLGSFLIVGVGSFLIVIDILEF